MAEATPNSKALSNSPPKAPTKSSKNHQAFSSSIINFTSPDSDPDCQQRFRINEDTKTLWGYIDWFKRYKESHLNGFKEAFKVQLHTDGGALATTLEQYASIQVRFKWGTLGRGQKLVKRLREEKTVRQDIVEELAQLFIDVTGEAIPEDDNCNYTEGNNGLVNDGKRVDKKDKGGKENA